jgi:hypothetical protein
MTQRTLRRACAVARRGHGFGRGLEQCKENLLKRILSTSSIAGNRRGEKQEPAAVPRVEQFNFGAIVAGNAACDLEDMTIEPGRSCVAGKYSEKKCRTRLGNTPANDRPLYLPIWT